MAWHGMVRPRGGQAQAAGRRFCFDAPDTHALVYLFFFSSDMRIFSARGLGLSMRWWRGEVSESMCCLGRKPTTAAEERSALARVLFE